MTEPIEVAAHNRPHDYWFHPDTGVLRRQTADHQPDHLPPYGSLDRAERFRGTCQKFLLGGTLVMHSGRGPWTVQLGPKSVRLGDPELTLQRRQLGPFTFLRIRHRDLKATLLEWRGGAILQRLVDPTYDGLDKYFDDFVGALMHRHASSRIAGD